MDQRLIAADIQGDRHRVARSSLARRRRAERALVVCHASSATVAAPVVVERPGPRIALRRFLPTLLIVIALLYMPVTCAAMSGPHSLFLTPSQAQAEHAHHHHSSDSTQAPPAEGNSTVASGPTVRDLSELAQAATGLVAVLGSPASSLLGDSRTMPILARTAELVGRIVRFEPPPPRI